jgi:glyoxylase-like metal-dependent hydrolase (beta-lactamase superfamily II)
MAIQVTAGCTSQWQSRSAAIVTAPVPPAAPNDTRELAAVIWHFAELGAVTTEEDDEVHDAAANAAAHNQEIRRGMRERKAILLPDGRESRYDGRPRFPFGDQVARRARSRRCAREDAMKRTAMATAGALALALTAAAALHAQQQDFSKVEIKTTKVAGNFYTLEGQGGTIGVLAGPQGVLMVDSQFAPLTDKIVAAIKQISNAPIRFMINTHVHGDHTGGNANLGKLGVTIFSRPQLRTRLEKPAPGPNGAPGTPTPPEGLPVVTYDAPVTIHLNGEQVELIPIPVAHTDGDTMVRFRNADVIMTGDFYRSVGYPNIDRANGGSLNGMLEGLQAIVNAAGPATKIIPGHGETVDKNAVAAHRAMIVAIRDKIAPLVRQGMTQDQVVAAKPTADYDSKVPGVGTTGERFVGQLYAELKK